ncbi:hypothetical protein VTK56DRAFT_4598 [Thermocarpiscus australiensis]
MLSREKDTTAYTPSNGETPETQYHYSSRTQPSTLSKAWQYLNDNVRPSAFAELELVILTFCIGVQDAVSFPDFHCFASNQTGNTVFLMLAVVLPEMNGDMFVTANIGVALGLFLAAAWLTGQLGHVIGARRRLWLVLCNLTQTCLVFAAAGVQYWYVGSGVSFLAGSGNKTVVVVDTAGGSGSSTSSTLVAIGLLAAAAGSQVVQSRSLRMPEISTAMATAAWVDLLIDRDLFALRNRPRNRRLGFLGALILGSLAGAFIFRRLGSAAALVVSGAGKMLVTVMFLFNEAEREKVPKGEESA